MGEVTGVRAFVPHEHYDPIKHANYTPADVDAAERKQVCEGSSIPVVLLCEKGKLEARRISRLLRGNPAVVATISYGSQDEALDLLREHLSSVK